MLLSLSLVERRGFRVIARVLARALWTLLSPRQIPGFISVVIGDNTYDVHVRPIICRTRSTYSLVPRAETSKAKAAPVHFF